MTPASGNGPVEASRSLSVVWATDAPALPAVAGGATAANQTVQAASLASLVASAAAGEDPLADVQKVEERFSYANITTATTTLLKSGGGFLHRIVFNKRIAAGVTTIYDSLTAAGNKIATITEGAAILSDPPQSCEYNVEFATGLTVVTSAAEDITMVFR